MPSSSADPTTIKHKFLVGYQGWCAARLNPYLTVSHTPQRRFYCHGDGEPVGPGENALSSSLLFDRHTSSNQVITAGYTGLHILSLTVDT